jgi:hypothetical protein
MKATVTEAQRLDKEAATTLPYDNHIHPPRVQLAEACTTGDPTETFCSLERPRLPTNTPVMVLAHNHEHKMCSSLLRLGAGKPRPTDHDE